MEETESKGGERGGEGEDELGGIEENKIINPALVTKQSVTYLPQSSILEKEIFGFFSE